MGGGEGGRQDYLMSPGHAQAQPFVLCRAFFLYRVCIEEVVLCRDWEVVLFRRFYCNYYSNVTNMIVQEKIADKESLLY